MTEPRPIPMIDLKTQLEDLRPEIDEAIDRVLSSTAFVFGPDIAELEQRVRGVLRGRRTPAPSPTAPTRSTSLSGPTGSAPATRS